jgi:hypothetical protein
MKHEMLGYVDGDWIKFLCPECDKQRWLNRKTKKIKSSGGNFFIEHSMSMGPIKMKSPDVSQEPETYVKPEANAWLSGRK